MLRFVAAALAGFLERIMSALPEIGRVGTEAEIAWRGWGLTLTPPRYRIATRVTLAGGQANEEPFLPAELAPGMLVLHAGHVVQLERIAAQIEIFGLIGTPHSEG